MKTWKKVACLALSLTMVGSFAACGDKKSDKTPTPSEIAKGYTEVLSQTLADVKTFRVELSLDSSFTEKTFGADGQFDESLTKTEVSSTDVTFTLTVEENGFSVHQLIVQEEPTATGMVRSYEEIIIVGGYEYSREYAEGADLTTVLWEKEVAESTDVIQLIAEAAEIPEATLRQILASKEIKDFGKELKDGLAEALKDKLEDNEMTDGAASWTVDFGPALSQALTYLQSIDESAVTLEYLFGNVMAMAGTPINYTAFVNGLKEFSQKSVSEALDVLSAQAQAQYGMTLQQLLTQVMNSELAQLMMTDVMGMDAQTVETLKQLKVEDLKGLASGMTVADVINKILLDSGMVEAPADGETPIDYCANALQQLEEAGAKTLQQLGISFDALNGFGVSKLALSTGIDFSDDGTSLEALSGGIEIALSGPEMETVEDAEVQTGVNYVAMAITVKASQFSSVKTPPTAPAANMIAPNAD